MYTTNFYRGAVFLGGDKHFQRVNHVPQNCTGSVWLENSQSCMWVSVILHSSFCHGKCFDTSGYKIANVDDEKMVFGRH